MTVAMKKCIITRLGALGFALLAPALAHAALTIAPITWNVIGLDSNNPATGPKYFPVGARVCSDIATTNVTATWAWDSANPNINLRAGSLGSIVIPSIAAASCRDAYFEVEVNPVVAAFDTVRRYHIVAGDGSGNVSTPTPRELYVERLISQNRNSITGASLDGVPIPAGGSVGLVVGNTYTFELRSGTATQGYNQFEAFINFSNTIFQILSVTTAYSANNSPYVVGPAPAVSDKLYADACLWQNDPSSPTYRSCVGGDYKSGGADITTTYVVRIIGGGGTSQTLSTLLYDFSGSSYHYNSDFSVGGWIANIVDPTALTFSKSFAPAPTVAGGTSTLTFTIGNPTAAAVSGVNFTDPLPLQSGGQMVVASPATYSTSGCGTPTFAPVAGATSLSFANGTVAANSSCTVSVRVSVPSTPTTGTYVNTSNHLFAGTTDTGRSASASLGLTTVAPPPGNCGITLAQWTMGTGAGAAPPPYSTKSADVAVATAVAGAGITASTIDTAIGNPANSWATRGYSNSAPLNPANNDYIEFAVTTTNYNGLGFSFDVRRDASLNGPASLQLYSSTDGANFTPYGGAIAPTATFVNQNPAFTNAANTGGLTYFRIYGWNAANNGVSALLYVDNVTVTGCRTPQPPTIAKSFLTSPVAVGGTSTLQFALNNPGTSGLTGVRFSDSLPAGMQVAASPAAATTCTGAPTWAPAPGATTLDFGQPTGATLAAGASCTVSVDVTVTTAGPHTNVSGFVSATESGTNTGPGGSATATLTAIRPPSMAKAFAPNPVMVNGTSLLTFTVTNPNPNDALNGVAFADTYPAGLTNANPLTPAVANTCGGAVTAAAGGNAISLAGGTVAAGSSCTVTVPVTAAATGSYVNTSGPVSAFVTGAGNTAGATLTVEAPSPDISVLKRIGTSATGPWLTFVTVAPGTPLYYQFTAENIGDVALNPFSVADPTLAGTAADPALCTWVSTNVPPTLPALPVATATVDPTATCVVGPVPAVLGAGTNTATAQGTFGAIVVASDPSTAQYVGAVPGFNLLKQIGASATGPWTSALDVAAGASVWYRFTITNTGGLELTGIGVTDPLVSTASCSFSDPLAVGAATMCVVGPVTTAGAPGSTTTNTASAQGSNGSVPYVTPPSSATYTISPGSADLAVAKTNGATSVSAGGSTTYTITVTNNGPDEVTGATVVDTAPTGLTFGTWTCAITNAGSGGIVTTACGAANGSGNLATTVTMKVGAVITYTVPATVAGGASGSIANTATVTAPSGIVDPAPANNSATDTDPVTPVADLAIGKDDGATSVNAGASTVYTITVTNNGPSAITGAILADPAATGLAKTTVACSATPGQCVTAPTAAELEGGAFALPALASGATYQIAVTATVTAASGSVTNTATVAAPAGTIDPTPGNNSASDTDTVIPAPVLADLSIAKTNGVASVTAGGSTTYTITVTNNGPSSATGAILADPAATGLSKTAVACSATPGQCATAPTVAELEGGAFALPALASGATYEIVVTATVTAGGGTVSNTATVAAPAGTTDPTPGNNSATDTDPVVVAPVLADLAITKTDGVASVTPGGATTYTIVVTNNGPGEVTDAAVTDTAPAGLTFGAWTCAVTNGGSGGAVTTACGAANGSRQHRHHGDDEGRRRDHVHRARHRVHRRDRQPGQHRDGRRSRRRHRSEPRQQQRHRHRHRRHRAGDGGPRDHQDQRRERRHVGRSHDLHDHGDQQRPLGRDRRDTRRSGGGGTRQVRGRVLGDAGPVCGGADDRAARRRLRAAAAGERCHVPGHRHRQRNGSERQRRQHRDGRSPGRHHRPHAGQQQRDRHRPGDGHPDDRRPGNRQDQRRGHRASRRQHRLHDHRDQPRPGRGDQRDGDRHRADRPDAGQLDLRGDQHRQRRHRHHRLRRGERQRQHRHHGDDEGRRRDHLHRAGDGGRDRDGKHRQRRDGDGAPGHRRSGVGQRQRVGHRAGRGRARNTGGDSDARHDGAGDAGDAADGDGGAAPRVPADHAPPIRPMTRRTAARC